MASRDAVHRTIVVVDIANPPTPPGPTMIGW